MYLTLLAAVLSFALVVLLIYRLHSWYGRYARDTVRPSLGVVITFEVCMFVLEVAAIVILVATANHFLG